VPGKIYGPDPIIYEYQNPDTGYVAYYIDNEDFKLGVIKGVEGAADIMEKYDDEERNNQWYMR